MRRSSGDKSDELAFVAKACSSLCISKTPARRFGVVARNAKPGPRTLRFRIAAHGGRKTPAAPLGLYLFMQEKTFSWLAPRTKRTTRRGASPRAGRQSLSIAVRPEREGELDGAARRDDPPALPVDLYVGQALGGVDEYALDLLRRERGVGFDHAGDRRGDDGRGERSSAN